MNQTLRMSEEAVIWDISSIFVFGNILMSVLLLISGG